MLLGEVSQTESLEQLRWGSSSAFSVLCSAMARPVLAMAGVEQGPFLGPL